MGKRYKKPSPIVQLVYKIINNTILFIFVQLLVFCTFTIGMIYYGPFTNLKEILVTSAMTTLNHKYIATWFLSDTEINEIMKRNMPDDSGKESDESAIEVINNQDADKTKDKIELIDISRDKMKGFMLIVHDPRRIALATTEKMEVMGMKLKDIVEGYKAVGGINAGGFEDANGKGLGGTPTGVVIENGTVVWGKEGVEYPVIGFNKDSVLVLGRYTLEELREKNIKDAVSFQPFLIVNGEPTIKSGNGGWGYAPRTAIGQRKDGAVLLLVIDGRQPTHSIGATLKDVQDIMLSYGAYNAANLDGGSSTTMVYDDKVVNKPSSIFGPRAIPTAFIIKQIEADDQY